MQLKRGNFQQVLYEISYLEIEKLSRIFGDFLRLQKAEDICFMRNKCTNILNIVSNDIDFCHARNNKNQPNHLRIKM